MNVVQKIKAGAYYVQGPRPERPSGGDKAAMHAWRHAVRVRQDRQNELEHVHLKADLAAEHGLTDHPKLDRLFEFAWNMGHASGLLEVAGYFEDLAELLR
jgi:hypothetical protein